MQATLAGSGVRYVAICPTGVFGPMLQPSVNATMNWVASMTKGQKNGKCVPAELRAWRSAVAT